MVLSVSEISKFNLAKERKYSFMIMKFQIFSDYLDKFFKLDKHYLR